MPPMSYQPQVVVYSQPNQQSKYMNEDGLNDLDLDSNDEFDGDMDDDNLSFDGIYDNDSTEYIDMAVTESPRAEFAPQPPQQLCVICQKKPSYSKGGKSFPTCGNTCRRILENAIETTDPNDTTHEAIDTKNTRRIGYQRERAASDRGMQHQGHQAHRDRGNSSSSNGSHSQLSSTTYVDPNFHLLTQHLGGYNSQRNQARPAVIQERAAEPVLAVQVQPAERPGPSRRANPRPAHTQPQLYTEQQPPPPQKQQKQQLSQPLPQSFRRRALQDEEDDLMYGYGVRQPRWVGPPPSQATSSGSSTVTIGYNRHNTQGYNRRERPPNYQVQHDNGGYPALWRQPPQPTGPPHPSVACVVCRVKACRDSKYVTCGLTCAEKLCKTGSSDATMCDYCHRRPKQAGHSQCGAKCRDSAKLACLLCKSRPKYGRYHLCGKSCKQIAIKSTPLVLEAPPGHATFVLVEKKFKDAWKVTSPPCPPIKKIFKIIENKAFLQPYDRYKKSVGNEVFRYHGTSRKCTLGTGNNSQLCNASNCALCNILKTSFKTSLANPSGAFGAGVYTSSASNKSYSYTGGGTGAVILTKVILGKPRNVTGWNEVMSCPPGFNSVIFDRNNGTLNETIVYSDDAIRPVFLIVF